MDKFKIAILCLLAPVALLLCVNQLITISNRLHQQQLQAQFEEQLKDKDESWMLEYLKNLKAK